jgi:hypothetical protein
MAARIFGDGKALLDKFMNISQSKISKRLTIKVNRAGSEAVRKLGIS